MKIYRYSFLAIAFLLSLHLWAYQKPYVVNINRETYKAANKNWAVGQDERGVMYFGNDIGLLESDGMDWRLHRVPNSPIVRAVAIKSHETVFTGGFEEIGRWDRDVSGTLCYTSFKNLVPKEKLQNENIWKIWIDQDKVYFQSFSYIYIYENQTIRTIGIPNGFLFLIKVRDEFLVQEMYGPLYRFSQGELHKMENCDFLDGKIARVILPFGDNQYLIGVSTGEVYLYNEQQYSLWNKGLSAHLSGKELNCGLYSAKRNMYYLGTQLDGVYEVNANGDVISHFSTSNILQNNTILSIYEDNLSNIWTAMDRGLAFMRYTDGVSYFRASERDAGAVYDASLWRGHIFIGTNQGVYYAPKEKLDDQNFFSSLQLIDGTQGQVWSFAQINGRLFCGHNNGMLEIRPDFTAVDMYNINTGVYRMIDARIQGVDLLLVVSYKDVVIIRKDTGEVLEMKQINDPIYNIEVDHLENIWLETLNRGVYKCKYDVDLRAFRYYTYYGDEMDEDLPEKLKLFRSGGRVLFLGGDTFWAYDENSDKMTPNTHLNVCFKSVKDLKKVVHISQDQNWAITGSSIYRFKFDGYIARMIDSYNIESDNLSLITMYENISVLNDTLSMICLDTGFMLHSTNQKSDADVSLPIPYFESIKASSMNGKALYLQVGQMPQISNNYNDITIRFTVCNAFAYGLLVEYQLVGVDQNWSSPVKANKVTYDRLPKGEYTFLIRTTDGLGHYSDTATLKFKVLSPWFQTYWAYLLYVVLVLVILYGVWMLILRRYRNIHLQKVRAREAQHLRMLNEKLIDEVRQKNAELVTQTSFVIHKNELIQRLKDIVDDFRRSTNSRSLQPLYQKINALLSNDLHNEDDWKMFLIKFEEKHAGFFKKLKEMHPQLTTNDLRLCACLKLNLDTKDIASFMNLSIRGVENNRYRLRKKLNISSTQNLNDYILTID